MKLGQTNIHLYHEFFGLALEYKIVFLNENVYTKENTNIQHLMLQFCRKLSWWKVVASTYGNIT